MSTSSRSSPRRPGWRFVRIAAIGVAAIAAVSVLVIVFAAALILSGPTEVGFLRDRIAAMVQEAVGSRYAVEVERAIVDVDPVLGLVLRIANIEVRDANKAVVARAPETRVAVDPLALLTLRLQLGAIEVGDARLFAARGVGGRFYLGNSETPADDRATPATAAVHPGDTGGFPALSEALYKVDQGLSDLLGGAAKVGVGRLGLVGASVVIWDAAEARHRRLTDADVHVELAPEEMTARIAASGASGRWTATLRRMRDSASGGHLLDVEFSELGIADVLPSLGDVDGFLRADMPLYGRGEARLAANGAVTAATLSLAAGAGVLAFANTRETIILDEATLNLRWAPANEAIAIAPSPIFFGQTRGVVTGRIAPASGGGAGRYAFAIESRDTVLAPSGSDKPPLSVERIGVAGVYDNAARRIDVDELAVATAEGTLTAVASLGLGGPTPSLTMAASVSSMTAAAAKRIWPPFIVPGARGWVLANVRDGRIVTGSFEAEIPSGILGNRERPPMPEGALDLRLGLEDVAFHTFGDLPLVRGAAGNLVLDSPTLGVDLERGEVRAGGDIVAVSAGAFAIDDVFRLPPEGRVEVELSGAAEALGAIADSDPLHVLARRGLSPADLSGSADVSVSVRLPLLPEITEADVDWRVTVNGHGLASDAPIDGRIFSNADVALVVTPGEVAADGTAEIDGVMADVAFVQPLGIDGASAGPGRQSARLVLDEAARRRLGVDVEDFVSGSIEAFVTTTEDGRGQHFDLDLHDATLAIPGLGWSKGAGVPASLAFDLIPVDDGAHLENVVLTGADFGFTGTARLDAESDLVSADIAELWLRPGDSVAVRLAEVEGGYAITARGAAFDVRGVLDEIKGVGIAGATTDITVDADIASLGGFNNQVIKAAKVSFVYRNGITRALSLSGTVGDAPLVADYSDRPEGASLRVASGNAGDFLRFLDFYNRVGGGVMRVDGERLGATGPLLGTFEIETFSILDEPAVQELVSAAAVGRKAEVDAARLRFEQLVAQFRWTDDEVAIDEGLVRGPKVGATFGGLFDLAGSLVSISGTYIPLYTWNNAFSHVPIIGTVLGGSRGEGLIGVTFKVEGAIEDPGVRINPLSAVTPGIFRKIFEFR